MRDLKSRLVNRVQITSDGHGAYINAVKRTFGNGVDFKQLVKIYKDTGEAVRGRYSPAECIGTRTNVVAGNADEKHISTSYAERQNLTLFQNDLKITVTRWHFIFSGTIGFVSTRRINFLPQWLRV